MKNIAFAFIALFTLISSDFLNCEQEQNQISEINTRVTLNMEQLPESYKKAVALALAKMAQNLAQPESNVAPTQDTQQPMVKTVENPNQKTISEHLVVRTAPKTIINLQPNSNDVYNIRLKTGDTLVLAASRQHPAFYWETDIIAIDPEVLNYAKRELIPQEQFEGACLFYMHFNALKTGEVEMIFNSENFIGVEPTSQQFKIAIE